MGKNKGKLKKKHRILIIVAIVFVLMILLSVYTVAIRPSLQADKVEYQAAEVYRGDLEYQVTESGAIEYQETAIKYELDLEITDDDDDDDDDDEEEQTKYLVVETVYKSSGEMVSAGEPIIKFEKKSIESVRKLLASSVADAQVDYNDAKSTYELSCLSAETDYKNKLIDANYAGGIYRDQKASIGNNISAIQTEIAHRQAQIPDLEEAVSDAQSPYNEAAEVYRQAVELIESLDPSEPGFYQYQQVYLQAQRSYNNALTALENARSALSNNASQIAKLQTQLSNAAASKGVDTIDVNQEYEETKKGGDNAILVYQAKIESLTEDFNEEKNKLKEKEEQQQAFEDLVGDDGIVYAPKDGLIVSVNVEDGEELTSEKTMVSFVCAEDLTISVDVTEEDIVSLAIGQNVDIVFNAYPEEKYEGKILSIDTTATSSGTNTVSYPVVVSLPGDLTKMYGGMTTKISFTIDSREDTIYISRKALVESNGNYYVYVKSGLQDYELKQVTIGLKNTSYAEVLSGLDEKDTIYIATTATKGESNEK